jgi:hypothetical protein
MSIQYKNSDYKNFENIISDNEQKVAESFSLKEEILKEKSFARERAWNEKREYYKKPK